MPKRLGEMLIEAGLVDHQTIDSALARQQRSGGRIASNLLAMEALDERDLALTLSRQQGVPFLVLSRSAIRLDRLKHLPVELARKHRCLPVYADEASLYVALADPRSLFALDEVRFSAGSRLVEHGALSGPLQTTLETAYGQAEAGTTIWIGVDCGQDPSIVENGHLEIVVGGEKAEPTPSREPPPAPQAKPQATPAAEDDWVKLLETGQSREVVKPQTEARSLLVVDDEDDIRQMFSQYLTKSGYRVRSAADGKQALQMLKQELPEVIVLDAMLPGIHGFDLCQRIKQSEATSHVRVIMVSAVYRGWRYAEDVKRNYGADAFLEKPLRLDHLKHVIELAMEESKGGQSQEDLTIQASAALQEAAKVYRKGDVMGAVHHLRTAIAAAPFAVSLHARLAKLYESLKEYYRAIASLERACELEPIYANLVDLAKLYAKAGFTAKAFEAWERCLRHCPSAEERDKIQQHMQTLLPGCHE